MMDFVLEAWVSGIIERKKIQWMMGKREPWQPGEKLKLLFAGYNGTRNWFRCACGGNAAPDSADSWTRKCRPQHDDI